MAELLWTPSDERIERANVTQFARKRGLPEDYGELWQWSVDNLDEFWAAVWDEWVEADAPYEQVLARREMPGAEWFPGAQLNSPKHIFRTRAPGALAIQHASESRPLGSWTWGDLERETARIAAGLRALGVEKGDRVAAYMPNIPETVAAFLATASIGAVWSSAAPEFGARSVIYRFAQI
jgi:acetoacetyl-CoA synthetase